MGFHVSHESQWATTKCPSGFSCLTGEPRDLCAVENHTEGNVQFIKCLYRGSCSYQHPFKDGDLCGCPVRKEIFTAYQI
jgi:hypothetical protein